MTAKPVTIIELPVSRDLYSLIADAARLTDDTLNVWIRQRCEKCARQEIAEHEQQTGVALSTPDSRSPR